MSEFKDLTGQRFGRLIVTKLIFKATGKQTRWECLCDCGIIKVIQRNNLLNGHTQSCGCMHNESLSKKFTMDLTGQVFGRLTVLSRATSPSRSIRMKWLCKCTCGTTKEIQANHLRSGVSTSCGCYAIEKLVARNLTRPGYISKSATAFLDKIEQKFNIKIEREFPIKYRYFDGKFKNYLIEVDGEYWHSDPDQKQIDEYKNQLAKGNGFKLIRCTVNNIKEIDSALSKYGPVLATIVA